MDRLVAAAAGLVAAGTSAGEFSVSDAEATAGLVVHAVHGLLHEAIHRPEDFPKRRVVSAGWELISRAVGASPDDGSRPARKRGAPTRGDR